MLCFQKRKIVSQYELLRKESEQICPSRFESKILLINTGYGNLKAAEEYVHDHISSRGPKISALQITLNRQACIIIIKSTGHSEQELQDYPLSRMGRRWWRQWYSWRLIWYAVHVKLLHREDERKGRNVGERGKYKRKGNAYGGELKILHICECNA